VLQKAGGASSADEDADPLFGSPSNTIFTFTPAVVPIQQMQHRALQGDLGSSSGTMARGLVAMSPPLGRDSKPSPVMNADDVSSIVNECCVLRCSFIRRLFEKSSLHDVINLGLVAFLQT
jgi:hypothetical protein